MAELFREATDEFKTMEKLGRNLLSFIPQTLGKVDDIEMDALKSHGEAATSLKELTMTFRKKLGMMTKIVDVLQKSVQKNDDHDRGWPGVATCVVKKETGVHDASFGMDCVSSFMSLHISNY